MLTKLQRAAFELDKSGGNCPLPRLLSATEFWSRRQRLLCYSSVYILVPCRKLLPHTQMHENHICFHLPFPVDSDKTSSVPGVHKFKEAPLGANLVRGPALRVSASLNLHPRLLASFPQFWTWLQHFWKIVFGLHFCKRKKILDLCEAHPRLCYF